MKSNIIPLLLLFVTVGCGGPKKVPVEGKVVWGDGSDAVELVGGAVEFNSEEPRFSARGEIRPDATFRMDTDGPNDGVPLGTYRVLVTEPFRDPDRRGPPPLLDPRFHDFTTSGLQVTVEPGIPPVTLTVERIQR